VTDHANRRRPALEDLRRDALELCPLLEEAEERRRLLGDLRQEARPRLAGGTAGRLRLRYRFS
jgi:hypothetical protein